MNTDKMISKCSIQPLLAALAFSTLSMGSLHAAPFGGADDLAYAGKLWGALQEAKLAGEGRIVSTPYKGSHPHGAILDTIDSRVSVGGTEGAVIIKNNYGGPDVSKQAVADNPDKFLKAVTVMFL